MKQPKTKKGYLTTHSEVADLPKTEIPYGYAYPELRKKMKQPKTENKPICGICGKPMENAIDTHTGKINKYLWKTTCEHNKNLILSRG